MTRVSLGCLGQLPSTAVRRSVQARKSSSGLTSSGAGRPLSWGLWSRLSNPGAGARTGSKVPGLDEGAESSGETIRNVTGLPPLTGSC